MDQPYQGSAIHWLYVVSLCKYKCTGHDHTYCIDLLIGIALKELMVCDVDHYYLRLVILCKTGGGDMYIYKRCCLQKHSKNLNRMI